jgi:hypothetical protein
VCSKHGGTTYCKCWGTVQPCGAIRNIVRILPNYVSALPQSARLYFTRPCGTTPVCGHRSQPTPGRRTEMFISLRYIWVCKMFAEIRVYLRSWNVFKVVLGLYIKSRRMRWVGHVARMGESSGVYRVLVGKPEEKRPLWRPRRRREDNIKMDLREVECEGMDSDRCGSG